jgi:hypothetical protein
MYLHSDGADLTKTHSKEMEILVFPDLHMQNRCYFGVT